MKDLGDSRAAMQRAFERAQAVKRDHEQALLARPNVVGVGVGLRQRGGVTQNQVALVILVREKVPSALLDVDELLPAEIEGVPVDVQQVGDLSVQEG